jgi:hypothetical protein
MTLMIGLHHFFLEMLKKNVGQDFVSGIVEYTRFFCTVVYSSRHGISGITVNISTVKECKIGVTLLTSILPFVTILIDMRKMMPEIPKIEIPCPQLYTSRFFAVVNQL